MSERKALGDQQSGSDALQELPVGDWLRISVFNLLLGLVAGLLVWAALGKWLDSRLLIPWVTVLFAVTGLRLAYAGYLHFFHSTPQPSCRHKRAFAVLGMLGGAVWGGALFLAPQGGMDIQLGLFLVVLAVSGLVYVTHALNPGFQLLFSFPVYAAATLWIAEHADRIPWQLALVPPFLLVTNWYVNVVRRRNLLNPVRERVQNALLRRQIELSERSRQHEAARKSTAESDLNRTLRLFLDGPAVAYRFRRVGDQREIQWLSENIYQFGYNASRLTGERWESLVHPDDVAGIAPGSCAFADGEDFTDCHKEYRLRCKDGGYRWIYDYIVPVFNRAGTISFFDGYFIDVTSSHRTREALAREKERAQVTLQSIGDAVITTGIDGRVQFLNGGAESLTGWLNRDASGVHLNEVLAIRIDERKGWIRDPLNFFYQKRESFQKERVVVEYCSRDGDIGLVEFNVSPIESGGEAFGHVLVLREVTEQEELRKEIEFQARHDDLTGIYNRWEFENRFRAMLEESAEEDSTHILMFLDLDQFKLVNDTCGHHCGDELLRQLTAKFGACLDNEAILARLGGDEFGVLLKDCSVEQGMAVAEALRDSVRKFRFAWEGRTFQIGVSIGIVPVVSPFGSIHHLMKLADVACYLAKERGSNSIRLHHDGDQELARRRQEMNWATRLKGSMAADDFSLHYQDIVPIGEAANPRARKIEILLRLRDGDGELLSPVEFLPSAERYNLMPELDRWVIRKAFQWYEKTGRAENVVMNINLSGLSFCDAGFLEYVESLFQRYRVPPGAVCFEVTETAAIQNLADAESFMYTLRSLGCRFALDDFGTGLSSFEYLKVLPVDYVKIDGRFVKGILDDDVDRAMVSAINDVGHTMNIQTVAEYVESEAILGELSRLKVDFAQGYGIGQPRSLESFSQRVSH